MRNVNILLQIYTQIYVYILTYFLYHLISKNINNIKKKLEPYFNLVQNDNLFRNSKQKIGSHIPYNLTMTMGYDNKPTEPKKKRSVC